MCDRVNLTPEEEVELLDVNPQYAHVKFNNGRESAVSVRDLAPFTGSRVDQSSVSQPPVVSVSPETPYRKSGQ